MQAGRIEHRHHVDAELFEYLQRILTARVYDVAVETALELAPRLSARLGCRVWLKREDTQSVFSFKLRGAYNKMVRLTADARARGVICASAGNHAQGVALSAHRLGCRAVVVMPVTTPTLKSDNVRALGAEVILHGDSYSDAYQHAVALERAHGLSLIHPFDDPDVIAGQGTIAMEMLRQHQDPIHAIFVAVGGGGLISGVAAYVKAVRPEITVVGVQMVDSNAMVRSIEAGERVELKQVGLFSDGTAVKDVFEDTRSILEPAGAMSVAGLKQYAARNQLRGQTLIAIACGANMNFDRLRFVAERAEVGEGREALIAVTIPEERGSFRRLCELIGQRSVTEFSYRISDARVAHVFVGIATHNRSESAHISQAFEAHGFSALELLDDELSKEHVRYMVGGRSSLAQDEHLYQFEFPERPGALMRFLACMHPNWNISLFHYRNQGSDYGRILLGIQVRDQEVGAWTEFLETIAYPYTNETNNPVYHMFLR